MIFRITAPIRPKEGASFDGTKLRKERTIVYRGLFPYTTYAGDGKTDCSAAISAIMSGSPRVWQRPWDEAPTIDRVVADTRAYLQTRKLLLRRVLRRLLGVLRRPGRAAILVGLGLYCELWSDFGLRTNEAVVSAVAAAFAAMAFTELVLLRSETAS